ncbi:MAG TPA: pilus assembly protein PilM, partial [Candidatus Paceibacterota bacterium]|nr:pilus assembly protein PilM [Candidatus Paceibacterota bacterium]
MVSAFRDRLRAAFAPPEFIAPPLSGIDLSTSGVKAAHLDLGRHGLTLESYAQSRLDSGGYAEGEIVDRAAVVAAIKEAAQAAGITAANVALPESKSYLFETTVEGKNRAEWRLAVEQHLEELVPLPPAEAAFDIIEVGKDERGATRISGVAFARRIVEDTLSAFDEAGIVVRALEGETYSMARALLPVGDTSTTLLIDVGKTTTKLAFVTARIPRFAATIGIGGHALTLAVQKHFGVTEAEARKVKAERGIVPSPGNEDYIASMLSTVSAIRDEIAQRLVYWQEHAARDGVHAPVTHAILAGGNA